jgi:hypothetical protein
MEATPQPTSSDCSLWSEDEKSGHMSNEDEKIK